MSISLVSLILNEGLRLNDNGQLNKVGFNSVYDTETDEEIATMKIAGVHDGLLELSDFVSVKEGEGNGRRVIEFLFNRLPRVNTIHLKCKDGVLGFWTKVGGKVVKKENGYNIVDINRKDGQENKESS